MLLEWVHFLENSFLEGVTALYNAIGWSGVGLLMAIENTFIPLPSEVIMPFAGWKLVLERGLGISWILWAGFVGAVGSLVGAILEYYVARYAGRGFIIRYGKWFLLSESEIIKTEKWFEKWGTWAVVIVRFIPGLRGSGCHSGRDRQDEHLQVFVTYICDRPALDYPAGLVGLSVR